LTAWRPGGDLRREAELIQQFGSPTTILLCALIIWRLDPLRLPRMLDWLLAAGMTWLSVFALKITLGRPRPKFVGEHLHFLGPWNTHVVKEGDPPRHAWEVFADDVAEIWSMPSSHTAFAVVAAICLTHLYPRLRPVAFGLAAIVGFCRVLLKAHYASDVLIGAAMGYLLAEVCMTGMLGQRLAGRFKTPRRD
ncbi:MAG: phosphatase PAP2 family protein, partial [Phycisphaerae bacterium]|nr:phosphatase PAP2 family protein [Phycisphaerae bacterium]